MILGLLAVLNGMVMAGPPLPRSFGYVLQAEGLNSSRAEVVRRLAECGRDGLILDIAVDGSEDGRWTGAEVELIRAGKPGRKVLAYLSIGTDRNLKTLGRSVKAVEQGMEENHGIR